jgi:hypothetical protein
MSMNPSPKATRRSGWGKKLGIAAGALILLMVVGWFVIGSGAFLKSFVLPRVGSALNSKVTVESASWSPFSSITLRKLVVHPNGAEPLLQADELRARYHLWSIIGGNIAVDEISVEAPKLTIIQKADGTSNLDPLTKSAKSDSSKAKKPSQEAKAPQLDVKAVSIKNGLVRVTQQDRAGADQVIEVNGLNFSLADLKNSGTARVDLGGALALTKPGVSNAPASTLAASLKSALQIAFDANLKPQTTRGETEFAIAQATGDLKDAATVSARIATDISPTEVKQLSVAFSKAGQPIGVVQVSGPFDLAKQEGKLSLTVGSIDRQVLNVAGALAGLDFGDTSLSSTNSLELKNGGKFVAVVGRSLARSFSVTQGGLRTPALDLTTDYQISVDQTAQNALVQSFTLDGTQRGRPLLHGSLSKPMRIDWGSTASAVDESALKLTLTGLDFADWRPFVGTNVRSGTVNADVDLLSQQAGKRLAFSAAVQAASLAADFGTTRVDQGGLALTVRATLDNFQKLSLTQCTVTVSRATQEVASLRASGTVDLQSLNTDLQAALDASLPAVTTLAAQPGLQLSAGNLQFSGSVRQQNQAQLVKGSLRLSPLSGVAGDLKLDRLEAALDCDVVLKDQVATINQFAGRLISAGQPGGAFSVSGRCDLQKQAAELVAKLTDLNQNVLRPVLNAALGNKQLVSGSVNANLTVRHDPKAASAFKGDLQASNFVIHDPSGQIPRTPLGASAAFDASLLKQVLDLRQCRLALAPTARATNVVDLTGKVDLSQSNAITGSLKLAANALDVTTYYDLFTGGTNKPAVASTTTPTTPKPEAEPVATQLPFRNFLAEAAIGRFWLREVAIANLQAAVKLDGGHIVAKPLQCGLNGVPVSASADVDLGVPGYRYDVTLNAPGVLLAPLVNSFVPERKGQFGGTLVASAQIKGAGITGAGLQRNLTGQFNLETTNLNLAIPNLQSSTTLDVINGIIAIPEGIKNPRAFVDKIFGRPEAKGGWTEEFTKSPINTLVVRGVAGSGMVQLQKVFVESAAFQASTAGEVAFAPVLNDSRLNFPVSVSLQRKLADQVGLTPANTPTNASYVRIPDFVTVRGTLGKHEVRKDYLVLAQVALKASGGVLGSAGNAIANQATGVFDAVSGLFTGQPSGAGVTNATGTTNQAGATTTNRPFNPLNLFSQPRDTNRPANPDRPKDQTKSGKK